METLGRSSYGAELGDRSSRLNQSFGQLGRNRQNVSNANESSVQRDDLGRVFQVQPGLGGGQEGIEAQAAINDKVDEVVRQVEERALIGAQLAGRGYAQRKDIAQAAGLTIPQTTQQLLDKHNYAHTFDEIKHRYLKYGENEEFFGNVDPVIQVEGEEIINRFEQMTPEQQRLATYGARAAGGPMTSFNLGFANNLLLIQQARLRTNSMYGFV